MITRTVAQDTLFEFFMREHDKAGAHILYR